MKEPRGITEIPSPPLPKWALDKKDEEYKAAEPKKRDEVAVQLTTAASIALDVLEWHARNMQDAKSSISAACALLDRAGYAAAKGGSAPVGGFAAGGAPLAPAEEQAKRLSDRFQESQLTGAEDDEEEEGKDAA